MKNETSESAALPDATAELERVRKALAQTSDNLRRAVTGSPGTVVVYDVLSIADTLDAILLGGDTSATNDAAEARCAHVASVIRSMHFHFTTVWSSVGLKRDGVEP